MVVRVGIIALSALFLAGVATPATAAFTPADCWFSPPPGQSTRCGWVNITAEDGAPDATLPVAILKANTTDPAPDPVLYIEGGPGASPFGQGEDTEERMEAWWTVSAPLRARRDVILFDPRGVGRARPAAACPELSVLAGGGQPKDRQSRDQAEDAATRACAQRMIAAGNPPDALSTPRAAADVFAIIRALSLPAVNLLAVSYGTRVAFAMLRDPRFPIRSVVLDGVYPPDANPQEEAGALARRGLDRVFSDCAANRVCRAAHLDLADRFTRRIEQLITAPADLRLPDAGNAIRLTAGRTLDAVLTAISQTTDPRPLPAMMDHIAEGRYRDIAYWVRPPWFSDGETAEGVALSIECRETVNTADPKQIDADAKRNHPFDAVADDDPGPRLCPAWPVGRSSAAERLPVASPVPALLISGAYDTVTPPDWGERAVATLPHGRHVVFRAQGHVVTIVSPCAMGMAAAFIDKDDPNDIPVCAEVDRPPRFPAR